MTLEDRAARAEAVLRAVPEGPVPADSDPVAGTHPLAAAASEGPYNEIGTVNWAGQLADGRYLVEFRRPDGTPLWSQWPAWAYELARTAFVNDLRLWLLFDELPHGGQLIWALLYPRAGAQSTSG